MRLNLVTILAIAAAPTLVAADGPGLVAAEPTVALPQVAPVETGNQLRFTAGLGVQSAPGYFGADETVLGPTGTFRFEYLRFGDTELGTADPNAEPQGFSFGGSVRLIADRTAEDFPELAGLEDLDLSLEVGAGVSYTRPNYEVFADLRYGVVGHEALLGEVGMDVFARPSDQLTLSIGPRVFWGSDDFADAYFSVDGDAASPLEGFEAEGGILSAGVELGATYAINDTWGVEGSVRWDRYLGDAAESPIVTGGSEDSVTATIMATRRFTLDF